MIILFVLLLVLACGVVGATMPNRSLGSRYSKLYYSQAYEDLQKPISRKTAFWMEVRILLLLLALVGLIGFLCMVV